MFPIRAVWTEIIGWSGVGQGSSAVSLFSLGSWDWCSHNNSNMWSVTVCAGMCLYARAVLMTDNFYENNSQESIFNLGFC